MRLFDYKERSVPEPEDFGPKEVFAFFGLASYEAQVLERGLVSIAVALRLAGESSITQNLIESLFEVVSARTMGQVVRVIRSVVLVPESFEENLSGALHGRNRLVHNFFWNHAENFLSDAGRAKMIAELQNLTRHFHSLDRRCDEIALALWKRYGLTEAAVAAEIARMERKVADDHLGA